MNIGKFSVSNPVLLNVAMVALLLLGGFSLSRLPREQFREVPFYWVFISVPYPGAVAEDIERTLTIAIENEVDGIDKVKEITSVTREGLCIVRIQFDDGISQDEFQRLFQEVQTRFNKVELPDGTLEPLIDDFSSSDFLPVIQVILSGKTEFTRINTTAKVLKDLLRAIPGVSEVDVVGVKDRQIRIRGNQQQMEAIGISLDHIIAALRARNLTIPGGNYTSPSREYLLRTIGELESIRDLGRIIIRQGGTGGRDIIRIDDVASVTEELDEEAFSAQLNGKPSVTLKVAKSVNANAISIVNEVKKEIASFGKNLPKGITIHLFNDSTILISNSISTLTRNALFGFVLLVIILYLFLGFRNALVTALGIPLTFAITFIVMEALGETLNSNSLFALVLVLGMIVDHAIVIIENSYRLSQQGLNRIDAAIQGTNEVVAPLFSGTLTTIAAFLPLMILPGILGKFFRVIPLIVTIALAASTFEALVFLPIHFVEWGGKVEKKRQRLFEAFEKLFREFINRVYTHKKVIAVGSIVITVGVLSLVATIKQDLFSGDEYSYFYIDIELPIGSPREKTNELVASFEDRIMQQFKKNEIVSVVSTVGFATVRNQNVRQNNLAQIVVDIAERSEGRKRSIVIIMNEIKELCRNIPGTESVNYRIVRGGPPVDPPVSFSFYGDDYGELIAIANDVKKRLSGYPELYNIEDNLERSTPELRITVIKERAGAYGLSVASIGSYIRACFDGITATTLFDKNEEVDIIVSYDEESSGSVEKIRALKIPAPGGLLIPFSSVCEIEEGTSIAAIKRVDLKRQVTVTAEANDKKNIPAINRTFEKLFDDTFKPLYPAVTFQVGGEFAEFATILIQIARLFLVGIFLIYVILGAQFKSYLQPFLILFTIPYAFAGIILFLVISGTAFSTTVMYAGVALAGISVNDSIVLISFINRLRAKGKNITTAVIEAAGVRFRPIFLTSVTTIGGLLPTALGIGGSSPVWRPMANTIIFGLLFSTLTALILIPCWYGTFEDIKKRFTKDINKE